MPIDTNRFGQKNLALNVIVIAVDCRERPSEVKTGQQTLGHQEESRQTDDNPANQIPHRQAISPRGPLNLPGWGQVKRCRQSDKQSQQSKQINQEDCAGWINGASG